MLLAINQTRYNLDHVVKMHYATSNCVLFIYLSSGTADKVSMSRKEWNELDEKLNKSLVTIVGEGVSVL